MSYRKLDLPGGQFGGVVKMLRDIGRPRTVLITVINTDSVATNNHAAFFGNSRREVDLLASDGLTFGGFVIPVQANTAPTAGVPLNPGSGFLNGHWIQSIVVEGWNGEFWAAADATGVVEVRVQDMGEPEK